jgi:hypothetical protein
VVSARRASEHVVGGASALVLLSSFGHAWPGWTQLRQALRPAIDADLLGAVGMGWHFGSISMATFGLLGLLSALGACSLAEPSHGRR